MLLSDALKNYFCESSMAKATVDTEKERAAIRYLIRLVQRVTEIRAIADQSQAIVAFDTLYAGIYKEEVWEQFKYIPVVSQEASELISKLKKDLILPPPVKPVEPIDLSDMISKIEVECERLHTTKVLEAEARFGKRSQCLTPEELTTWLQELVDIPTRIVMDKLPLQAIAPATNQTTIPDDKAPLLSKILALRTQLGFDKKDVVHFYTGKMGKAPDFGSSTELKILVGLLEVEIGDRAAVEKDSGDQGDGFF